jgi:hypothetical protein
MRTNIKPIHWVATPPLTGLVVLAATYPVTEDQFGPQCGSSMMNEVACDPLLSIVGAVLGVIAMLGILTWSWISQTRRFRQGKH